MAWKIEPLSKNEWVEGFQRFILRYYQNNGRVFFWRRNIDPYIIFLSEYMLQQTQTSRVETQLPIFLRWFPDFRSLAEAELSQVVTQWQGLGYNRRAGFLHESAKIICNKYNGYLPNDPEILRGLPGIGPYTSNSIPAFAYNRPTVFIETNIRRVFLHHFFDFKEAVTDSQIMPLIDKSLDTSDPRSWYYALMDYGAQLAKLIPNPNRRSRHYSKQSQFEGSIRQVRGAILRVLTKRASGMAGPILFEAVEKDLQIKTPALKIVGLPDRFESALRGLLADGLMVCDETTTYRIP